ncbi:type IV pilus biogenesis protein PilM [Bacillus kexueae]|uniref:type IV pilus biogenesis protein PilM n=1 Tax=Aeribacillus kexueae TaxID=2078952 RepID=UPI001FAF50BF|nr:pilus assembly protein PilM [Bacillus kexueae]
MKITSLFSKSNVANLEIKDDVIRFVEVKQTNPIFVSHHGEYYLEPGIIEQGRIIDEEAFTSALSSCIQSWNLKRKDVRFLLPDASVVVRVVDVPIDVPNDEIVGHLYFELDQSIHLPFDSPIIDGTFLYETNETKKVLLVAAPEAVVNTIANKLKELRTNPVVADISPFSQYRLFHHYELTSQDEHYLLIQLNMQSITVSIFDDERPSFMQQFPIPYGEGIWNPMRSETGHTLDFSTTNEFDIVSAVQDIYIEIERILRFYQFSLHNGNQEITSILLTGDHPFLTTIQQEMRDRFSLPIITIPNEVILPTPLEPKWFNALGLAVREGN